MSLSKNEFSPRHCMVVFAPYPLGETRVQREAEALARSGYQVDVICFCLRGELTEDAHKGVTIYRVKDLFPKNHSRTNGLSKNCWNIFPFFYQQRFE